MESKQPGNKGVPAGRVDVWSVRLDEPARAGSEVGVLSPDEVARASRFHFEKDRIHFAQCRSALRDLLAGYLAIPAAEIRFEYLASGKPRPGGDIKKFVATSIPPHWLSDSSRSASALAFRRYRIISACRVSLPAGRARKPS